MVRSLRQLADAVDRVLADGDYDDSRIHGRSRFSVVTSASAAACYTAFNQRVVEV